VWQPSQLPATASQLLVAAAIAVTLLALSGLHRAIIREHCNMSGLEEDEEEFQMRLGLRC
jgi:hypothetical protein